MKYFLSFLSIAAVLLIAFLCGTKQEPPKSEYLRIHIRANSNSQADQAVKYKVKDAVVDALIPLLSTVTSKDDAIRVLEENFSLIEGVADQVLRDDGQSYSSSADIHREYFPTRVYQNLTLEEGEYDALILNLGSGSGDNWWCVVYPAFCFLETKNSDNVVYISRIWDIIKNVLGF